MKQLTAILLSSLIFLTGSVSAGDLQALKDKRWYAGAADCGKAKQPAIEIHQFNADTYILRQNKCTNYEAPFIYLLLGTKKALLVDTGATADPAIFPIAQTVLDLMKKRSGQLLPLVVAHSHSHGDHYAGDEQFRALENVTLVEPKSQKAVMKAFGISEWPAQIGAISLGGREVKVIPTPGHQSEAVVFYDEQTRWMLTGDSVYPGRLYVRDWQAFRQSVKRLVWFSAKHPVSAIMGAHIEMSIRQGKDYPMGSLYHPQEDSLVMMPSDLLELHRQLSQLGDKPTRKVRNRFIIYPVK